MHVLALALASLTVHGRQMLPKACALRQSFDACQTHHTSPLAVPAVQCTSCTPASRRMATSARPSCRTTWQRRAPAPTCLTTVRPPTGR